MILLIIELIIIYYELSFLVPGFSWWSMKYIFNFSYKGKNTMGWNIPIKVADAPLKSAKNPSYYYIERIYLKMLKTPCLYFSLKCAGDLLWKISACILVLIIQSGLVTILQIIPAIPALPEYRLISPSLRLKYNLIFCLVCSYIGKYIVLNTGMQNRDIENPRYIPYNPSWLTAFSIDLKPYLIF